MSLTLSVTSSTTLFATNIAASATSLTFASSLDGTTYTDISAVTIPVGTTAYSLTNQLIPSYYYRVTASGGQTSVVQYILQTKGAAGSSTSSFSTSGSGTPPILAATSVTLNAAANSVRSDQIYSASQGVYFQLNTPTGTTMGNAEYNVRLFSTDNNISATLRVNTSGPTTTVRAFRQDNGAENPVAVDTTLSGNPGNIALYWDGVNTVYYYIGGALNTSYLFTNAWTTVRAAVQMASITTPFTLSDVRLYVTGTIASAQNWRLKIQNVTTTTLVSPAISTSTYGTYYYITNSGFSGLTLPNITSTTDTGAFWVLRNNTTSYLSVGLSGTFTDLISPIVIPPFNSTTIVWSGTGYVLF